MDTSYVSAHYSIMRYLTFTFTCILPVTFLRLSVFTVRNKCKAIPVRGCGGTYGCETSRLPHVLDNWLTDGGEVLSLKRGPPFTPPPGRVLVLIYVRG
jgi:hypothetical protein